jgi:hypothetical protein
MHDSFGQRLPLRLYRDVAVNSKGVTMTKYFLICSAGMLLLASCSSGGPGSESVPLTTSGSSHTNRAKPNTYTQELVVANGGSSVLVFGLTPAPSPTPLQDIHGSATGLGDVNQVSVGPVGNIFAASYVAAESWVLKFSATADTSAAPIAKVKSSGVDLESVVVDPSGNIIAGGWTGTGSLTNMINYYSSTANGYATPTKSIEGSNTLLEQPYNVAIDSSGNLYVPADYANASNPAFINIYSSSASGNAAPTSIIEGSHTKLKFPSQVWIDNSTYGAGRIVVADGNGDVLVFSPGATGNATPVQDITSVADPAGVATDSTGKIYVSAPNDNQIRIFAKDATGNATPVNKITGTDSKLQAPGQLFIAPYFGS